MLSPLTPFFHLSTAIFTTLVLSSSSVSFAVSQPANGSPGAPSPTRRGATAVSANLAAPLLGFQFFCHFSSDDSTPRPGRRVRLLLFSLILACHPTLYSLCQSRPGFIVGLYLVKHLQRTFFPWSLLHTLFIFSSSNAFTVNFWWLALSHLSGSIPMSPPPGDLLISRLRGQPGYDSVSTTRLCSLPSAPALLPL